MSSRFGRNQRRKMRAEIKAANDRADLYYRDQLEAHAFARDTHERMERWALQLRHMLGHDHAFGERLRDHYVKGDLRSRVFMRKIPPLPLAPGDMEDFALLRADTVIEAFVAHVRVQRNLYADKPWNHERMAVRLCTTMGDVAIGLDPLTAASIGMGPREAYEIAQMLVDTFNKEIGL